MPTGNELVKLSDLGTVFDYKLDKANVYNGLDKTTDGYALDARQGKALKDYVDNALASIGLYISDGKFYILNS